MADRGWVGGGGVNQREATIGPLMDVTKLREVRCGNPRNKPILQD